LVKRKRFLNHLILLIFLIGLIEHVSSIQCYTCNELGNHCPTPFNPDGGDESDDIEIPTHNYDSDHACLV